jgi:uncharacterized phage-associated protein
VPSLQRELFSEEKATQIAAKFLDEAGGSLNYMKLLKLMYLADRKALLEQGAPISDDEYFALENGPILSTVMDIIKARGHAKRDFWTKHISEPCAYDVELLKPAGVGRLSKTEESIIASIYAKHGSESVWSLVRLTHTFPEWKKCKPLKGKRKKIPLDYILHAGKKTQPEIEAIKRELDHARKMHHLVASL